MCESERADVVSGSFSSLKIKQQKLKQASSLSLGVCYVNVSRPVGQTELTPEEEDAPQQPCFLSQVVSDLMKQSRMQ